MKQLKNMPDITLGIVVGSTEWMPSDLAIRRRKELVEAYKTKYGSDGIYECSICITDNEISIKRAMKDLENAGCNALCLYFGNYGPEHTATILVEQFRGPTMFCAAAEDNKEHMNEERKDAYSGIVNACYALSLKGKKAFIPSRPVDATEQCVEMVHNFVSIARALIAVRDLKIISFGPRPSSYLAAYAPYHSLYGIGVEVDEYSEMELLNSYEKHANDKRIESVAAGMGQELGEMGNSALPKLAQYEITVKDWIRSHKGNRKYVALTSTCWPAFPVSFSFVPCYVNARLTGGGIPVACEVDVYGAISEYVGQCVSGDDVTILNYNNNVPGDIYEEQVAGREFEGRIYRRSDLFLGYHCGVTCSKKLTSCKLAPHFVNNKLIGSEKSQGTIQGSILPGPVTLFRIQGLPDGSLKAYVVQGQVLPIDVETYGGHGVIAVPGMARFYRYVLIEHHYPNHFALIFGHYGLELYSVLKQLGIKDIEYNHPQNILYDGENPFD